MSILSAKQVLEEVKDLILATQGIRRLTDDRGALIERDLDPEADLPPGCVVLVNGLTGTAYQRYYSDARFYARSGPLSVEDLLRKKNVFLIYRPAE